MSKGRAVAAALVVLLLAACSDGAAPDTTALGDATAAVPAALESRCPPDDAPLRLATGDLPSGAIGVRLCPGAPIVGYDGTRHGPFVQPVADELTTGIEPLVDLVNGLPEYEPGACHMDGGPLIVYWFRYPDGDARAVAYGERGCHTLTAGAALMRENGEELASAFADALDAQRAAMTPPAGTEGQAPAPKCPLPTTETPISVLPQVPLTLTAATWCQGVGPRRIRSATVPVSLVQRLNKGLLGERVDEGRAGGRDRCQPVGYMQSIEGVNDWGDRVAYWLVSDCRIYARVGYGRDTAMATFKAAPDLINALRALQQSHLHQWDAE